MFFLKELPNAEMIQRYTEKVSGVDGDAVEKALIMMRHASVLVRRLDAYFSSHQLSQLRFLTMIVIDREPLRTSLYASEIADRLDVSRPVLTRALKSLGEQGLINTKTDNDDGRAKLISLSKEGENQLAAILPGYFKEICDFMSPS